MASKPKAALLLAAENRKRIYGESELTAIHERCELVVDAEPSALEDPAQAEALASVEVLWSGWGGVWLGPGTLEKLPSLKLYLYGAGTVKGYLTDAVWERGIRVCGAWGANAIPVAEWTFAQIVLCLKHAWRFAREYRELQAKPPLAWPGRYGAHGTTVGLISLGQIGQRLARLLQNIEVEVLAYDPFVSPEAMAEMGLSWVDTLEAVFERCEVVSLHTPWLKETEKLIRREHFAAMRPGAAFINTARGAVVDEPGMIDVLRERPDLFACLDVTHPEPPEPDSPLWELENVFLTPHLAGAQDLECRRMARFMLEEFDRWRAGEPLQHEITKDKVALLA